MKQITIRGIPEEVEKEIKQEAEAKGLSLNKALISILEKAVGGGRKVKAKRVVYHDLDHLSGAWAREEAEEFDRSLRNQRIVDEELWKK